MESPATSPSTSLHIPATSRRKPRSPSSLPLRGEVGLGCRTNLTWPTVVTSKEHARGVSVSATQSREAVNLCNRNEKGWVHFVGIGGCGLSALAMLALKQGYEVSGSDIVWSSFMDGLEDAGARLHVGHSVSNMQKHHNGLILPNSIVVSSSIPPDNVEILYAKSVGVPVYKRGYWLAKLTEHYNLIAVSGTHGKSTTASMLAYVLKAMGDDVTAVVGAHVPQFLGGNIMLGSGQNFVLEADEYDGCFLELLPDIAVITNAEWEHVDIFENEEAVKAIFRRFLKQIRAGGHLILCGDRRNDYSLALSHPGNNISLLFILFGHLLGQRLQSMQWTGKYGLWDANLMLFGVLVLPQILSYKSTIVRFMIYSKLSALGGLHSVGAYSLLDHGNQVTGSDYSFPVKSNSEVCSDSYRVTTYGISSFNEWHASSLRTNLQGGSDYQLCHRGCPVADISLQIPGVHNVLNSLAVITTVTAIFRNQMHIYESVDLMRLHLNNFKGVSRRFEMIGRVRGCHICDDYAHHPTEVRAVLQAARQRFQYEDLLVVFQPHTYSRLAALKNEFANAFSDADVVVVTEIYGARETNLWKISGRDLATSIIGPSSEYIPSLGDVVDKLARYISKDPDRATAILTLGAGDITTVGQKLLRILQQRLQS